jgi:hypothetical protein
MGEGRSGWVDFGLWFDSVKNATAFRESHLGIVSAEPGDNWVENKTQIS